MSCAQCFLLVSKDCQHCRELLAKAKDAIELLSRRGMLMVNIEDFPELQFADVYEVKDGDLRLAIPTPQFICLAKMDQRWVKLYQYVIKSPEEFYEARRFLEAKVHMIKLQYGKLCFETRGRKKGEKEDQEPKGRRRGRGGRS
jgi:hypothetical protein